MARFTTRAGAVFAAAAVISLAAIPALGATGDVSGEKHNDTTGPVTDGATVNFTVELWNATGTNQNNIEVNDVMEPGLVYVPGSTSALGMYYYLDQVAEDALPDDGANNYITDTGNYWSTDWTEDNDDDAGATGAVRWTGNPMDQNAIGLTGFATGSADPLDNPGIIRHIEPAQLVDLIDAELSFATNNQQLEAGDRLGVWVSTNGGTTWSLAQEYAPGVEDADTARSLDLSPYLAASTLALRFGVSQGDYDNDGTWNGDDDELWSIDAIDIDGVYGDGFELDNNPSGLNNLDNGAPAGLILSSDNIDLDAVVSFDGLNYPAWLNIFYQATVDTSATVNYDTLLINQANWRSASYDELTDFTSNTSEVAVEYDPEIDVTVTSNGPVQTGQPIIVTIVLQHGDGSDGSPVCVDDLSDVTFPAGNVAYNAEATVGNENLCLEDGEVWTFTLTYPGRDTAGTVPFAVAMSGYSVNADDDFDITANASTDVVVVLADTGAANTGLAGVAAALVALGATALVVARRRNA